MIARLKAAPEDADVVIVVGERVAFIDACEVTTLSNLNDAHLPMHFERACAILRRKE